MLDALTEGGIETGVPYLSSTSLSWGRETAWACIPGIESNHMLWMRNHGDVTLNRFGCVNFRRFPLTKSLLWHQLFSGIGMRIISYLSMAP